MISQQEICEIAKSDPDYNRRHTAGICLAHMVNNGIDVAMHVGPFGDAADVRKGDLVMIRKGSVLRSTHPDPPHAAGKSYKIRVFDVHGGYAWEDSSRPVVRNPEVCWVGSGGYWFYTDLENVVAE